ncbi:MAG: Asp-tRNA(Asn)/Glu-tRNA(Gln) amidotransferase subunit GatA [Oscillospiraceae bacterium]|jgi:aspartyl-tRNA(Asn)/glutamyl-tRNA(Gln) amidotransferase subunit A
MDELKTFTALELARLMRKGRLSPVELARASLDAIEKENREINAVITVSEERALEQARRVERRLLEGQEVSPLAGVPILIKDNIMVEGVRMTCASRMLENYVAPYDASVIEKLEEAGLVIVGKANMDEFAMGSTGKTSIFGPALLPGNKDYCAGGSSSGSAAAVAAGMVPLSLGSDTGGSVLVPASYCGIWGIKPTYGAVSRYGMVAHASSLEQIGPMAENGADLAALLELSAGADWRDPTSVGLPAPGQDREPPLINGLKIAVPRELAGGCASGVENVFWACVEKLKALGARVDAVSVPELSYSLAAYNVISTAEASSNLSRFDGIRFGLPGRGKNFEERIRYSRGQGFGLEVKRRILLGTYVLGEEQYESKFLRARAAASRIKGALEALLSEYPLILCPITKSTAPLLKEDLETKKEVCTLDSNTAAANLAGLPAVSFPFGADEKGLPVGLHLMGGAFRDRFIIAAAEAICREVNL